VAKVPGANDIVICQAVNVHTGEGEGFCDERCVWNSYASQITSSEGDHRRGRSEFDLKWGTLKMLNYLSPQFLNGSIELNLVLLNK
jgi:hypothetical protein